MRRRPRRPPSPAAHRDRTVPGAGARALGAAACLLGAALALGACHNARRVRDPCAPCREVAAPLLDPCRPVDLGRPAAGGKDAPAGAAEQR